MHLVRSILTIVAFACVTQSLAAQPDLTVPLTSDQVACNEGQLGRLLGRIITSGANVEIDPPPLTTLVSYSNPYGFFEGLALTSQYVRTNTGLPPPGSPESYLAFNLNPSVRTLLLNPARQPLGQIELVSRLVNSYAIGPA